MYGSSRFYITETANFIDKMVAERFVEKINYSWKIIMLNENDNAGMSNDKQC